MRGVNWDETGEGSGTKNMVPRPEVPRSGAVGSKVCIRLGICERVEVGVERNQQGVRVVCSSVWAL